MYTAGTLFDDTFARIDTMNGIHWLTAFILVCFSALWAHPTSAAESPRTPREILQEARSIPPGDLDGVADALRGLREAGGRVSDQVKLLLDAAQKNPGDAALTALFVETVEAGLPRPQERQAALQSLLKAYTAGFHGIAYQQHRSPEKGMQLARLYTESRSWYPEDHHVWWFRDTAHAYIAVLKLQPDHTEARQALHTHIKSLALPPTSQSEEDTGVSALPDFPALQEHAPRSGTGSPPDKPDIELSEPELRMRIPQDIARRLPWSYRRKHPDEPTDKPFRIRRIGAPQDGYEYMATVPASPDGIAKLWQLRKSADPNFVIETFSVEGRGIETLWHYAWMERKWDPERRQWTCPTQTEIRDILAVDIHDMVQEANRDMDAIHERQTQLSTHMEAARTAHKELLGMLGNGTPDPITLAKEFQTLESALTSGERIRQASGHDAARAGQWRERIATLAGVWYQFGGTAEQLATIARDASVAAPPAVLRQRIRDRQSILRSREIEERTLQREAERAGGRATPGAKQTDNAARRLSDLRKLLQEDRDRLASMEAELREGEARIGDALTRVETELRDVEARCTLLKGQRDEAGARIRDEGLTPEEKSLRIWTFQDLGDRLQEAQREHILLRERAQRLRKIQTGH